MCVKLETCKRLQGIEEGIIFGFVKKGGSNFTPWRIWLGTCQTGDTAAPTHRREEEKKKRGSSQSKADKRAEVPRQTIRSTNGKPAWVGKCVVFTNDNNNKNSCRR